MLFEIFLILVILVGISVVFPPFGAILSMPIKIVSAGTRISGPLIAVLIAALIIFYAFGIIQF